MKLTRSIAALLLITLWGTLPAQADTAKTAAADYKQQIKKLRPLAEKGDDAAQVEMGWFYFNGNGVEKDYVKAAKWFHKAADRGNPLAEGNLGKMYALGLGVPQDDVKAARFFRMAADKGNNDARMSLGLAYALGKGVPLDRTQAYLWLSLAEEGGMKLAGALKKQIALEMPQESVTKGEELLREWKSQNASSPPK